MSSAYAADMPVKAPPAPAPAAASPWDFTVNQEVRYFSWSSTPRGFPTSLAPGGHGTEVYAPLAYQAVGRVSEDIKLELFARGGYVSARQSIGGVSGQVSTTTDTMLSATATYYGWNGFQPFLSVNVNAPTGKTALFGLSARARMDSDLVDLPTFGEGWNVGPTLGVIVPLTDSLFLSFGAGYTNRGPYDREAFPDPVTGAQGVIRLDPSDVFTGNASIDYQVGALSLRGAASYSVESNTLIDGALFYKSGNRYFLSGTAAYAWNDSWTSSVSATFSHSDRNQVAVFGLPGLVVETFNSNNNVVRVAADSTYKNGALAVGPTVSYLQRDHNAYDPVANQFVAAKTRWGAGGVLFYTVNKQATLSVRAERIWIHEDDNPAKVVGIFVIPGSAIPAVASNGWMLSLGGVVNF